MINLGAVSHEAEDQQAEADWLIDWLNHNGLLVLTSVLHLAHGDISPWIPRRMIKWTLRTRCEPTKPKGEPLESRWNI